MTDTLEGFANAALGLAISMALVVILRALGWWDASPLVVGAVFFAASWGRSVALRRVFRRRG